MTSDKGSLTLVATPIGNLGDLSERAREALIAADYWIVEDTRVSGRLAIHLDVKKPMRVLNDHTDSHRVQQYLQELRKGGNGVLVTDGGAPAVSDPGAILTDLCYANEVPVHGIPGPSAPILALMLSGFFAQRFAFLGFLGRKPGSMRGELSPFVDSALTLVLFESPHRIDTLLAAAAESLGERRYIIARELTKVFEQIYRSTLPHIPDEGDLPRKGEITLVIEGRRASRSRD